MTKSTITRERIEEIILDNSASLEEFMAITRMALAAMGSKPVAEVLSNRPGNDTSTIDRALPVGTQLYHHAQSAPVVPQDVLEALQKVARIRLDLNDFDGDCRGIADCLWGAEEALLEVVKQRAAMLQAGDAVRDLSTPVDPQVAEYKQSVMQGGSSPVIPDGYVVVPKDATLDMLKAGAKQEMKGEAFQYVWQAMLAAAPQEVK
ncbi:hypothetical protein [Klebsiella aerogenes]|uniref:hypothetical protein n=1 Tax=Klebsiella aerogenes TaxID=548 RepID=UPI001D52D4E6|nr:hypothetical protein [Klebsiella aerogenes]MCB8448194.1 hypothetical protein [Klebsiella aerogenes]MCB8452333.1 hypothetical protein [Klebsiella aerogenes]